MRCIVELIMPVVKLDASDNKAPTIGKDPVHLGPSCRSHTSDGQEPHLEERAKEDEPSCYPSEFCARPQFCRFVSWIVQAHTDSEPHLRAIYDRKGPGQWIEM